SDDIDDIDDDLPKMKEMVSLKGISADDDGGIKERTKSGKEGFKADMIEKGGNYNNMNDNSQVNAQIRIAAGESPIIDYNHQVVRRSAHLSLPGQHQPQDPQGNGGHSPDQSPNMNMHGGPYGAQHHMGGHPGAAAAAMTFQAIPHMYSHPHDQAFLGDGSYAAMDPRNGFYAAAANQAAAAAAAAAAAGNLGMGMGMGMDPEDRVVRMGWEWVEHHHQLQMMGGLGHGILSGPGVVGPGMVMGPGGMGPNLMGPVGNVGGRGTGGRMPASARAQMVMQGAGVGLEGPGGVVPYARDPTPRRYLCSVCSKRFTRPSTLRTHMNSHTGERPFACPTPNCGWRFTVLSNLKRHMRICPSKRDTEGWPQ
ncbi:hypothetical protein HDU76_006295, partial [Blyttiomyces sp. JEL0837]